MYHYHKDTLTIDYTSIHLIDLYKTFGWDMTHDELPTEARNFSITLDIKRERSKENDRLILLEKQFVKSQIAINRSIWNKLKGKPRFSKKVDNTIGCFYFIFALIFSGFLTNMELIKLSKPGVDVSSECITGVLYFLNLLILIYSPIIVSEYFKNIKIRKLMPEAQKMFMEDKKVGELREEAKKAVNGIKKLDAKFNETIIDSYMSDRISVREVGYGFPLGSFIYYPVATL